MSLFFRSVKVMDRTRKSRKRKRENKNESKQFLASILAPADLPELYSALPPTFTFPLARLVMEYCVAANNGFNVALWRLFPSIEEPAPWMADCFNDWCNVVFQDVTEHPLTCPLAPHVTANHQGVISISIQPSHSPFLGNWIAALECFLYLRRAVGESTVYQVMDGIQKLKQTAVDAYNEYFDRWGAYYRLLEVEVMRYTDLPPSSIFQYL